MIESEIIRTGLTGMLQQLDPVQAIHVCDLDLFSVAAAADADILIVTLDEWRWLGDRADELRAAPPPLLVLGDEPPEQVGELFGALPVDGFLSLQKLSLSSAEESLRRTVSGDMPMPAALARRLLTVTNARLPAGSRGRSVALTHRETETLTLLADGLSNKQIARQLGISIHGAKRLVGAILLKFGAPNRTGAVVFAQKAGLV
jgi:two-component system nitrate/nitrite response regulator NarL